MFSSTEVSDELWDQRSIETKLPYRDVVVNDLTLVQMGYFHQILADREWVVGISMTSVRGCFAYILKRFWWEADYTCQQVEGGSVRFTVYHLG